MKVGLDKKTIIEAAANMADERGIAIESFSNRIGSKIPIAI